MPVGDALRRRDSAGAVATSSSPAVGPSAWTLTQLAAAAGSQVGDLVGDGDLVPLDDTLRRRQPDRDHDHDRPGQPEAPWTTTTLPAETGGIDDVSCGSPTMCVAVDGSGNVLTSTDPTGGAGAWTITAVDGNFAIESVSCPTASFCMAVDDGGNAVLSGTPTGGAADWETTSVDQANVIDAVSCSSPSACSPATRPAT